MKAASIISYVVAAILIIFSFLFILGAFSPSGSQSWLFWGAVGMLAGFGLIYAGARFASKAKAITQNVSINIDLPGNVKMDTIECVACGAPLSPQDISLVNGAPMVHCPYCGASYQLTEEPKW